MEVDSMIDVSILARAEARALQQRLDGIGVADGVSILARAEARALLLIRRIPFIG